MKISIPDVRKYDSRSLCHSLLATFTFNQGPFAEQREQKRR